MIMMSNFDYGPSSTTTALRHASVSEYVGENTIRAALTERGATGPQQDKFLHHRFPS